MKFEMKAVNEYFAIAILSKIKIYKGVVSIRVCGWCILLGPPSCISDGDSRIAAIICQSTSLAAPTIVWDRVRDVASVSLRGTAYVRERGLLSASGSCH